MTARPTLVLIPGMMCDARLFCYQVPVLNQVAEVQTAAINAHETIEAIATSLLNHVKGKPLAVAGLSMGAIVAMEMIRQQPRQIARVALLNTNHRADTPQKQALRSQQIDKVRAGQLRQVLVDEMKPLYLAPDSRLDAGLLQTIVQMGMDLGAEVFIRQTKALAGRRDYSATLAGYRGQALVICGDCDLLCPPALHRDMAELLEHKALVVLKNCGHLSTLEQPDAVNNALLNWLQRTD